jgi:4-hydroxy-tetrahydrodipicolinate synthase
MIDDVTVRGLAGLWVPLLTPFRDDLSVDFDRIADFGRERLDDGCHGLALMGTTSETASLSVAERMRILEVALAAGIAPAQLTCGTGACALPDAVELTRHAVQTGCLATMILPPFYFKGVDDEGCFRSIAAVIERVADPRLRVVLYNIPSLAGVTITPAVVQRLTLAFDEVIVGVKDSSGDPMSTLRLAKVLRGRALLPGTEGYLVGALKSGATGCVTATANVRARPIRELLDDPAAANARDRQAELTAYRSELERDVDIIVACKRVLAARTGHAAWALVRPPLVSP